MRYDFLSPFPFYFFFLQKAFDFIHGDRLVGKHLGYNCMDICIYECIGHGSSGVAFILLLM